MLEGLSIPVVQIDTSRALILAQEPRVPFALKIPQAAKQISCEDGAAEWQELVCDFAS